MSRSICLLVSYGPLARALGAKLTSTATPTLRPQRRAVGVPAALSTVRKHSASARLSAHRCAALSARSSNQQRRKRGPARAVDAHRSSTMKGGAIPFVDDDSDDAGLMYDDIGGIAPAPLEKAPIKTTEPITALPGPHALSAEEEEVRQGRARCHHQKMRPKFTENDLAKDNGLEWLPKHAPKRAKFQVGMSWMRDGWWMISRAWGEAVVSFGASG